MDTRFAISEYNDAVAVNKELNELIKKPIYTIKPEALKNTRMSITTKSASNQKHRLRKLAR